VLADELYLLPDEILFVLVDELGEVVDYFNDIFSLDLMVQPKCVKETNKVTDFARQDTSRLRANLDDLLLCEAVLAELAHELLKLIVLAAIEVGEASEDVIYLSLIDLVVQSENELDFLNLFAELLLTNQLGAIKECLHDLLILESLGSQGIKEHLEL
jgi:hypothetical protein